MKIIISQLVPDVVCSGASAESYPSKYPGFAVFPPGHSRWNFALPLWPILFPACAAGQRFRQCTLFVFFHKNCDTGQISKTESSAQKLLQEIHSFSSTKAPCFALLSRAEGIGVYKSQQILDSGCITHGETSGIIFFLISNMLTLQDLERMAHHTWQDSSEDYRARRSLHHLS